MVAAENRAGSSSSFFASRTNARGVSGRPPPPTPTPTNRISLHPSRLPRRLRANMGYNTKRVIASALGLSGLRVPQVNAAAAWGISLPMGGRRPPPRNASLPVVNWRGHSGLTFPIICTRPQTSFRKTESAGRESRHFRGPRPSPALRPRGVLIFEEIAYFGRKPCRLASKTTCVFIR